jgi:hypothetical protein
MFFYGLEAPKSRRPLLDGELHYDEEFLADRPSFPEMPPPLSIVFLETDERVGYAELALQRVPLLRDLEQRAVRRAELWLPARLFDVRPASPPIPNCTRQADSCEL